MATTARPTRIGVIADAVLTESGNPYNLKFAVLDAQPAGVLDDLPTPNYVVGNALYRTGVIVDTDGRGRGVAWPALPCAESLLATVFPNTSQFELYDGEPRKNCSRTEAVGFLRRLLTAGVTHHWRTLSDWDTREMRLAYPGDGMFAGRIRGIVKPTDDPAPAPREAAEGSAVATYTATADRVLTVTATRSPEASPSFSIGGLPAYAAETRDRIRAAITNAGHTWPTGKNAVYVGPNCTAPSPAFDLAAACAVLAAGGSIDPAALKGVVLIGELGLDGRVLPVADVTALVQTAQAAGYRKVIVPAANFDEASRNIDVTPVGANTLGAALDFLEEMAKA
ncbi:hypothetical protein AQJ11_03050 [Streptomyces corchorusii]|uniref:Lon proteolytic domain-containing protein n=2 Tax=Streptomyces TaxID=1883 RepID=A0A117QJZ6_STRCK|nr:magnesium chelatase domain-containing protein [Streptomyces corchorusii]KUN32518.1 hypothetical protein AQJ11_03050 [Streptomyces corchorusii]